MLAFIGNLSPLEIVVIGVVAILVFGKRLPEVAGRFLYHIRRLRQSMYDLRRETGIDQEIRNVERTMRKAAWEAEARAAEEVEGTEARQIEGSTDSGEPDEVDSTDSTGVEVDEEPEGEARRNDPLPSPAPPPNLGGDAGPDPTTGPAST